MYKSRNPAEKKCSVQKFEPIESIRMEANNRHDKGGNEVTEALLGHRPRQF